MAHTDEASPKVIANFCDNSVAEQQYNDTSWGNITARDDFLSLVSQGEKIGTVFAKYPHVLKVTWVHMNDGDLKEQCEEFRCDCAEKIKAAANA